MYCRNNPIKYVDPSGESVVIAGTAITGELIALIGTGIVIPGYLASKAFVKTFTNSVNKGKSIRDMISYRDITQVGFEDNYSKTLYKYVCKQIN